MLKDQATEDLYIDLAKRLVAKAEQDELIRLVHVHVRRGDDQPVSPEQLERVRDEVFRVAQEEIASGPNWGKIHLAFKYGVPPVAQTEIASGPNRDEILAIMSEILAEVSQLDVGFVLRVRTDTVPRGMHVEFTAAERANADSLELVTLRPSARFPAR